MKATLGEGGRLVIPAQIRKAVGLKPGDDVIVSLVGGEVRLSTPREAIRRAQALVRRHIPPDGSLSDELIADRRAEAARE